MDHQPIGGAFGFVMSFLSSVTAFIAAHPHFAYGAVLLLALSESIPIVGVVVPGSAVILAIRPWFRPGW